MLSLLVASLVAVRPAVVLAFEYAPAIATFATVVSILSATGAGFGAWWMRRSKRGVDVVRVSQEVMERTIRQLEERAERAERWAMELEARLARAEQDLRACREALGPRVEWRQ